MCALLIKILLCKIVIAQAPQADASKDVSEENMQFNFEEMQARIQRELALLTDE